MPLIDFRKTANCSEISFCIFKCNCVNFKSIFASKEFRSPCLKLLEIEACEIFVTCFWFLVTCYVHYCVCHGSLLV